MVGLQHGQDAVPVHCFAGFAGLDEFDFAFAVGGLADDDGAAVGDVEVVPVEAVGFGDLAVEVAEEGLGVAFLFGPGLIGEHAVAGDADDGRAFFAPLGEVAANAFHFGRADACESEGVEAEDDVAFLDGVGEFEVFAVLRGKSEVGCGVADGDGGGAGGEVVVGGHGWSFAGNGFAKLVESRGFASGHGTQ